MTQEEKAKAYDRVSKEVKDFFEGKQKMYSDVNQTLEYLFPELAESEDERISKRISQSLHGYLLNSDEIIQADAWLKKQGEKHPDPYNGVSFEYNGHIWGMCARDNGVDISCDKHLIKHLEEQAEQKPTKWTKEDAMLAEFEKQDRQEKDILEDAILDGNEDGLIAETIKYKHEKQAEQKLDKVEPKFKVGDWIINPRTGLIKHIKNVLLCDNNGNYEFESSSMSIDSVDNSFHLWTIQDAKDGDVLVTRKKQPFIFKNYDEDTDYVYAYCGICDLVKDNSFYADDDQLWTCYSVAGDVYPATKKQRDLLFQKINEAGYTFDFERKELKKIENEKYNGEDYGIDSLYHAQRILEKTLGSVEGYQSDDGILEHKCAISAVKKLYEQNPVWSEEDENILGDIIEDVKTLRSSKTLGVIRKKINWLKSLRPQRYLIPSKEEIEKAAQEWDSKANFNPFYMTMENGKPTGVKQSITTHKESFKAGVNWILKFLRHWKSSDEQKMQFFDMVCDWYFRNFPRKVKRLNHLVNLNKLKEEE